MSLPVAVDLHVHRFAVFHPTEAERRVATFVLTATPDELRILRQLLDTLPQ